MAIAISYRKPRLFFDADLIEPLGEEDQFEIITPEGTFVMSKKEFYAEFQNVIKSKSYQIDRNYHYPKTPKRAIKFILERNESQAFDADTSTSVLNKKYRSLKAKSLHPDFNMPSSGGISGRTSSITAAFMLAITPAIQPTEDEVDNVLQMLGMSRNNCVCAYCGDPKTEWDHFRPIVKDKLPTGFITEICNLVPACGKCNQSKGNKNWETWIQSSAPMSPKTRRPTGLDERIRRLKNYDVWSKPKTMNYSVVFGDERWQSYLKLLDDANQHLKQAQVEAGQLLNMATEALHSDARI